MSEPTWWFVITSPRGETSEPEPPVEMRTADFCTCSTHSSEATKPYFSFSSFRGSLLTRYMPSSGRGAGGRARNSDAQRSPSCMGNVRVEGNGGDSVGAESAAGGAGPGSSRCESRFQGCTQSLGGKGDRHPCPGESPDCEHEEWRDVYALRRRSGRSAVEGSFGSSLEPCSMSRASRAASVLVAPFLALLVVAGISLAQEPLFTFVQVSDSQPATSADNRAFVDVLALIAAAGQPGAFLPKPVDLVLFAGDITDGNTRSEWVAAKQKLDSFLTANGIPFLAVPGNHDVDGSDTRLYEEFIADSGVWDAGSVAFTGHNGRSRTTGWQGLRFIGVDNSNPTWNTVSSADIAAVNARVAAADAAGENAFILCHHPHNEKSRTPLASALRNPSLVGYLHGHSGSPHVTKGLAGITNPLVWDVDTNAIYLDRDVVYFEVFPTQLRAHVVVLDNRPTRLPAGVTIPLAHPLTQITGSRTGFLDGPHSLARAMPTSRPPERKLWHRAGTWWGCLWSDAAAAYRIQRLKPATQTWSDTGPTVSTAA